MCGIAGIVGESDISEALRSMGMAMRHRGPDGQGIWISDDQAVGFVHQRLSIIELSELGHQPMASPSGQYVITFNGEIYNYRELCQQLKQYGYKFKGGSDTEVLLAAIEYWGVKAATEKCIGMFAFALWDVRSKNLMLVRDRLGIKPLYFKLENRRLVFASEIPALKMGPLDCDKIDRDALAMYFKYKYIPAPYSIYSGVKKVEPGTILTISMNAVVSVEKYWDLVSVAENGQHSTSMHSPEEYVEKLELVLEDAVRLRMVADVPLGAFLSGGVDSSTIVALMQKNSSQPIKTYTIGFHDKLYNEADRAKSIAGYLETDHHELYVGAQDMLDLVESLPSILGEPMADISILPTLVVCEMASKDVSVVLSGDGGDELFCGYGNYLNAAYFESRLKCMPRSFRVTAGKLLSSFYPGAGKLARLGALLSTETVESFSQVLSSQWQSTSTILKAPDMSENDATLTDCEAITADIKHYMMLKDAGRYMVDDILFKVDRASMTYSLEARVPIIDHRVVELAWQMPLDVKYRNGQSKWPLRQVLEKHVPKSIYDAPKQGFDVPISKWLRHELKDWAEGLIYSESLRNNEYIKFEPVDKFWREHQSRKYDRGANLWTILLFLNWQKLI